MPGIKAFGYRWLLATDDGFFLGLGDIIVYFPWAVWCCFKAYEWFQLEGRQPCGNPFFQDVAFFAFCSVMTMQFLIAFGMFWFSMRGTMSEGIEKRWPFEFIFGLKTIIVIMGPLWLALAGYVFYKGCFSNNSMKTTLTIATAFQALVSVIQIPVWIAFFDSEGNSVKSRTKNTQPAADFILRSSILSTAHKWKSRLLALLFLGFSLSKTMRRALASVWEIFAYIPRESDIVVTDFAVGVLLVKQKYLKYYRKQELKKSSSPAIILQDGSPVDQFLSTDMPEWMNLLLAKKHFRMLHDILPVPENMFQNAAFKMWNYLWRAFIWCFLFRRGSSAGRQECSLRNAKSCQLNQQSLYRDFVHVSFQGNVYFIPFCASINDDTSSIVIIVGGVMSAKDVIIDAIHELPSVTKEEFVDNISCHTGMLKAAKIIKKKLESNSILKSAISGCNQQQLVTTGHNLGASVATVLALLLRPLNSSVRCFAFEPVPCVHFESLETTFDTVFSVVFNNAVIPYLSFSDVEHMVKKIVKSARNCKLSKYKAFLGWTMPDAEDDISFLLEDNASLSNTFSKTDSTTKKRRSMGTETEESKASDKTSIKQSTDIKLYIPGRILHVRDSNSRYRFQILTAKDFHSPMILPDMDLSHSSLYIEECLEELDRTYTLSSANL